MSATRPANIGDPYRARPFTGFDPMDGHDERVRLSAGNPCAPKPIANAVEFCRGKR